MVALIISYHAKDKSSMQDRKYDRQTSWNMENTAGSKVHYLGIEKFLSALTDIW